MRASSPSRHACIRSACHRPRRKWQSEKKEVFWKQKTSFIGDHSILSRRSSPFTSSSLPLTRSPPPPPPPASFSFSKITQSTYCETVRQHCETIGRKVHVVNLGESKCLAKHSFFFFLSLFFVGRPAGAFLNLDLSLSPLFTRTKKIPQTLPPRTLPTQSPSTSGTSSRSRTSWRSSGWGPTGE